MKHKKDKRQAKEKHQIISEIKIYHLNFLIKISTFSFKGGSHFFLY